MENNQARTLAYNLAKELDPKELGEISGGAEGWITCQYMSFRPSGASGSMDGFVDITIDW